MLDEFTKLANKAALAGIPVRYIVRGNPINPREFLTWWIDVGKQLAFVHYYTEELKGLKDDMVILNNVLLETLADRDPKLEVRADWIVTHVNPKFKDFACSGCSPNEEYNVPGFKCYYHKAMELIGG